MASLTFTFTFKFASSFTRVGEEELGGVPVHRLQPHPQVSLQSSLSLSIAFNIFFKSLLCLSMSLSKYSQLHLRHYHHSNQCYHQQGFQPWKRVLLSTIILSTHLNKVHVTLQPTRFSTILLLETSAIAVLQQFVTPLGFSMSRLASLALRL